MHMFGRSAGCAAAFAVSAAFADSAAAETGPEERPALTGSVSAGGFVGAVSGAWWDLSKAFAPASGFKTSRAWSEAYLAPKIALDAPFGGGRAYGALSAVASYTAGADPFDQGDGGRIDLEEAYLGLRWTFDGGATLDLSAGAQPFAIGTGMLIADLGGDGFERGAMVSGPRRAAEFAAIARVSASGLTAEAFYLDPHELASGDSGTKIAGAHLRYDFGERSFAGASYLRVLESTSPYAQAASGGVLPFRFVPDGRKDLNVLHAYARFAPAPASAPTLWVAGEVAYQWREAIDLKAWAWSAEIGYAFAEAPFRPTVSYAYRRFSGDDPRTATLERFDGLFYDGATGTWAAGGSASLAFYNSNVAYHRVRAEFALSQADFLSLTYWRVDADETNSPIQFGQGARLAFGDGAPRLEVGVPRERLSDDLYLEYTRVLTPNLFLSPAIAATWPGDGLQAAAGGRADAWFSGIVVLTARY